MSWEVWGYDTFEERPYGPLSKWTTQEKAEVDAQAKLADFEKEQPTESSGGQSKHGIQDQIWIKRPNGTEYRVYPTLQLS